MAIGRELRTKARVLRAQADDQATAEAALALRARAAWLERQADRLEAEEKISPPSSATDPSASGAS
jgi:hypothetical protein